MVVGQTGRRAVHHRLVVRPLLEIERRLLRLCLNHVCGMSGGIIKHSNFVRDEDVGRHGPIYSKGG